mmetsp:Transcript_18548/g.40362  ORF Transcript_18548/g.40362 Transcript_18548/m.40362 type:complete len:316 (-) Transcript_18548:288-1235(-)
MHCAKTCEERDRIQIQIQSCGNKRFFFLAQPTCVCVCVTVIYLYHHFHYHSSTSIFIHSFIHERTNDVLCFDLRKIDSVRVRETSATGMARVMVPLHQTPTVWIDVESERHNVWIEWIGVGGHGLELGFVVVWIGPSVSHHGGRRMLVVVLFAIGAAMGAAMGGFLLQCDQVLVHPFRHGKGRPQLEVLLDKNPNDVVTGLGSVGPHNGVGVRIRLRLRLVPIDESVDKSNDRGPIRLHRAALDIDVVLCQQPPDYGWEPRECRFQRRVRPFFGIPTILGRRGPRRRSVFVLVFVLVLVPVEMEERQCVRKAPIR